MRLASALCYKPAMRIVPGGLSALVCICAASLAVGQNQTQGTHEPPMLGIHWQRGVTPPDRAAGAPNSKAKKGSGCSDCVTYHGGEILPATSIYAIYWGTSWSTPSFVQDKIKGIEQWYSAYPGSDYENGTMSEYCSGTTVGSTTCPATGVTYIETADNHTVSGITYNGSEDTIDTSTAGSGAKTSTILTEVCKVIQSKVTANTGFVPTANDYYPVYVDLPVSGGYCAYHSYGTCTYTPTGGSPTNVTVQFGFFWEADGNAGCASGDGPFTSSATVNGATFPVSFKTMHSEGLASLIDSTAHELSETRTDPTFSPTAWIDSNGQEVGDKCEWNTGYPGQNQSTGIPAVALTDGSLWVVQPEWSNKAALADGTSPNGPIWAQQGLNRKGAASGSYGCVYGTREPLFF
jgi:hypothetical protein